MQWTIDPAHSSIEFSVKHLGIATVRGRFREFGGSVELDERGRPVAIQASIQAATASCTSRTASSGVVPKALHPGRSGTVAI